MKQILGCGQGDNHVLDEHTDMVIKLQLRVSQQESGANIDHQEGGAHHICQPRIGNSDSPKIEKQIEQAWKPHHKNSSICSLKLLRKISLRGVGGPYCIILTAICHIKSNQINTKPSDRVYKLIHSTSFGDLPCAGQYR